MLRCDVHGEALSSRKRLESARGNKKQEAATLYYHKFLFWMMSSKSVVAKVTFMRKIFMYTSKLLLNLGF